MIQTSRKLCCGPVMVEDLHQYVLELTIHDKLFKRSESDYELFCIICGIFIIIMILLASESDDDQWMF